MVVMFFVKSFWRSLVDVCSDRTGSIELLCIHMVSSGAGCKRKSISVLLR